MSLLCLTASLYYTGAVSKKARYAPLFMDKPLPQYRNILLPTAAATFSAALTLSAIYLPLVALAFIGITAFFVFLYTEFSGKTRYWFAQNLLGAYICTSCVQMATVYSTTFEQERFGLALQIMVFSLYLLRETMKRLHEASINELLEEMPLKISMDEPPVYLGISGGMRIAGVISLFCLVLLSYFMAKVDSFTFRPIYMLLIVSGSIFFLWMLSGLKILFVRGSHHALTACTWLLIAGTIANKLT